MTRTFAAIAITAITLLLMISARYYAWTANILRESHPYDEVGISLHGYMPDPVQRWGCARLKSEFGADTLPPYGCGKAADLAQWR